MAWARRLISWYRDLGLQAKFAVQITVSVGLLFGALTWAVDRLQSQTILEAARQRGLQIARLFAHASVTPLKEKYDYLEKRSLVQSIASQRAVLYAIIHDLDGRILAHSDVLEEGRRAGDPLTIHIIRALAPRDGPLSLLQETAVRAIPALDVAVPVFLLNDRWAVARVGISLAREYASIRNTRRLILGSGALALVVGLLLAAWEARRITRPIQRLVAESRDIAAGHLEARLPVTSSDEIGHLAAAFNRMAESLQVRFQIDRELSSTLNLQAVLDALLGHAHRLAQGDLAFLACRHDAGLPAAVIARTGARGDAMAAWSIRPGIGWTGRVLVEGRLLALCPAEPADDPGEAAVLAEERLHALILLPVRVQGHCRGVLAVGRRGDGPFTPAAQEILERLSDQAAVALANALAYREIEELSRGLEVKVAKRTLELSDANAALAAANAKLQELDRLKSEFVSSVSHELRTPLTAIRMSVDNLLDGVAGQLDEPLQRYLARVRTNTDRLTRLITDLLDLSRIEAGRMELRLEAVPVADLVRETLDSLQPVAAEKGLTLVLAPGGEALAARADRDRTQQVLTNLAGNALKFTPAGGTITVTVREIAECGMRNAEWNGAGGSSASVIEIAVEDTGEGIPGDQLEAVFDKFHQVRRDGRAKAAGTGLGLAISRSLVELMGGRIWAESRQGQGSRFSFTLPAAQVPAGATACSPGSARP